MLHKPRGIPLSMLAASILLASAPQVDAADGNPLAGLAGSWRGSGNARFEGGKSERLTCQGHYTVKAGGSQLGLALRCASASAKIDLRSALHYAQGRVSGDWEERTFNASGGISGRASQGNLNLAISGGGISGAMAVSFSGSSQSVSINTSGSSFRGVSISLKRQ